MTTRFYLLLTLKTTHGFDTYGKFFLGEDAQAANDLFGMLHGSRTLAEDYPLHIDLMETQKELPVKIKTISCTINQLAENSKLITREIFKLKNLKAYDGD